MAEFQPEEENLTPAMERNISPSIIVQGGAYSQMLGHLTEEYEKVTKESAKTGYKKLMENKTAVEAVEVAVRVFEDNPCFNAGHGSYLNCEREVECDAMIMEGHTLNSGAVIGGRHFRNPISLCREIMSESEHCALSGEGALKFARDKNFPTVKPEELISSYAVNIGRSSYQEYVDYHYRGKPVQAHETEFDKEYKQYVKENFGEIPPTYDTVSAVAMDSKGNLACAMSTGGIAGKLKGRVGDAPLIGCGAYANKTGGATVTGVGESIMKMTLGREVVYNMENGQDAQTAAENALRKMKDTVGDHGGVIAIDKNGAFGKTFNTEKMVWASIKNNTLQFGLKENEVKTEQL